MTPAFDWRLPAYAPVWAERQRRLLWIREDKTGVRLARLKRHYRDNPADFINDWGVTYDPRNADVGLPTNIPFLLFPRQREFVEWVMDLWQTRRKGLADKSRDMGFSWLLVSTAATICLFRDGVTIGFGSRDEDSVDKIGDPDCLFWKLRFFIENLPVEFRGDWSAKRDTAHMRISFPTTGSVVNGDAGKNIGRGGRSSIYFVDEAAALVDPVAVEASLSQTTNCRIDVSTPKGMGNPFAQKRHSGKFPVFTMHWRQDPRKDDVWYAQQVNDLDPVTLAQEVDLSYTASVTGVLIPAAWIQAAVNAHVKLGIAPTGERRGALDVADEGIDLNAYCAAHGILVENVEAWSGKGDDIFGTVERAFMLSDAYGADAFDYDADGLGAGVRGDARVINETRKEQGERGLSVEPFRGSGAVFEPEKPIPTASPSTGKPRDRKERLNKDFFSNAKAQAWWSLRLRFQRTYRAVEAYDVWTKQNAFHEADLPSDMDTFNDQREPFKLQYDPDDLISLAGDMTELAKLTTELTQPTYTLRLGKVVVDKAPDGTRSPNHADAVMIRFAPRSRGSFLTAYRNR